MSKIQLLGDPHLGRSFIHGVPLARRGNREEMIWKMFEEKLVPEAGFDMHVNMGDLFDKAIVSYDTVLRAARLYDAVATKYPNVLFVILKGNHDLLRDLEKSSAFDVFAKLVKSKNIVVVTLPQMIEGFLFVGYHATIRAPDLLTDAFKGAKGYFGHNDVTDYGNDHNVIPTRRLAELGITQAWTGHIHKADTFERDGVAVTVVGSMQPYAHGEESDENLYVTLTLDQLADAGDLTNKCVRIVLAPGEFLEDEINCLQLTIKRLSANDDEAPVITMGEFDMEKLFRDAFLAANVSPERTEAMIGRYNDKRLYDESA